MTIPRSALLSWKRILSVGLILIAVIALLVCCSIYRMVKVVIPHSYAAWATVDLLIEYMETHDGKWPRAWNDLGSARDGLVQKGRNIYYQFERLPAVVKIDWNADPAALAKSVQAEGESALKVVTQPDGSRLESRWGSDTEPNRKVARYVIQRFASSNTPPRAKSAPAE